MRFYTGNSPCACNLGIYACESTCDKNVPNSSSPDLRFLATQACDWYLIVYPLLHSHCRFSGSCFPSSTKLKEGWSINQSTCLLVKVHLSPASHLHSTKIWEEESSHTIQICCTQKETCILKTFRVLGGTKLLQFFLSVFSAPGIRLASCTCLCALNPEQPILSTLI